MFFQMLSGEEVESSASSGFSEKKDKTKRPGFFEFLTVCEETEGRVYVEMLPTWKFTQRQAEISVCIICSVNFKKADVVRCLPCLHWYHRDCIDRWLATSVVCPVCKTALPKREENTDSEHDTSN
jgi:hypothetical protein